MNVETLRERLIAASLSPREYNRLRNTVKVIRVSGAMAELGERHQRQVEKFERVLAHYRDLHKLPD